MNATTFLATLSLYLGKFFPEEIDQSLKPLDYTNCVYCRDIIYDYIIVGAGSAGCVLANRLTNDPNTQVLLIEAGGDETYISDNPFYALAFIGEDLRYDWNYTTSTQLNKCGYDNNAKCLLERGKIMGGSSSISEMIYTRGSTEDYNGWRKLGNPKWDYKNVLPFFLKLENITIPELQNSPYHSTSGPLFVGYRKYNNNIIRDLYEAGLEYGLSATDYNSDNQKGISYTQFTVKGPTRCSASKAYLDPIRDRKNLYIFKNTLVNNIILSKDGKSAIGVKCETNGQEYSVLCKGEIILSAGAINTPKLLMLSGIGPKDHLNKLGIKVHHDLPVGENLMDHPTVILGYSFQSEVFQFSEKDVTDAVVKFAKFKTGVISSPTSAIVMFLSSSNTRTVDTQITVNVIPAGIMYNNNASVFSVIANLKPKSRGSVRLKSTNNMDPPIIDPNYFNVSSDRDQLIWGAQQFEKIMGKTIMAKYLPNVIPTYPICNYNLPLDDNDIECIIKYDTSNGYHLCGTAKMGPKEDKTTVVDSELRVHGVNNLRVVDASIFPVIPSGDTNAPTTMVAEKAAHIILNRH